MPVSFALEFYSLSWSTLRSALGQRKPELAAALRNRQWTRLLEDCDLRQNAVPGLLHVARQPRPWENAAEVIAGGLEEIAEAMARDVRGHEPAEVSEGAALVVAAAIRELGKPLGAIAHDGSVLRDRGLAFNFRTAFLDGVAGSCLGDHRVGENLAARPLFGLMHLDFLSWGGLAREEIERLLRNHAPGDERRQDEEWQAIADHAETWLAQLSRCLGAAASAKGDLVTLYLTVQKRFASFGDALEDELGEDFAEFGAGLRDLFANEHGA
jgi:hypothetical protein